MNGKGRTGMTRDERWSDHGEVLVADTSSRFGPGDPCSLRADEGAA